MTSDNERTQISVIAVRVLHEAGVEWPRVEIANALADAILAAGFARAPEWEYGASIDGGNPEHVWDEYPGDEGRANLEEGGAARMLRRRPAGPWESFEGP